MYPERPKFREYRGQQFYGRYNEFLWWKERIDNERKIQQERKRNEREAQKNSDYKVERSGRGQFDRYYTRGEYKKQHDFYDPETTVSGSAGHRAKRTRERE